MSNPPRLSEFTRTHSNDTSLHMWWLDLCLSAVGGAILFILLNYFSFSDKRVLQNAWTYLIAVPTVMVLIAMGLRTLAGQFAKRSLQLSFLVSVLIHLLLTIFAINVFIFAKYWPDVFTEISLEPKPKSRTAPQYFQQQINDSQTRPEYLRPVETEHDAQEAVMSKAKTEVVTTQPLIEIPQQQISVVAEQPTLRNRPEKQLSQPSITSAAREIDRQQSEISNNAKPRRINLPDRRQDASEEQAAIPNRSESAAATLEKRQATDSSNIQQLQPKRRKSDLLRQSMAGSSVPASQRISSVNQQPEIRSNARSLQRNNAVVQSTVAPANQIETPRFSEQSTQEVSPLAPRERALSRNANQRSSLQSPELSRTASLTQNTAQRRRSPNQTFQSLSTSEMTRTEFESSLPEISQGSVRDLQRRSTQPLAGVILNSPSVNSRSENATAADNSVSQSTLAVALSADVVLESKTDRDSQISRRSFNATMLGAVGEMANNSQTSNSATRTTIGQLPSELNSARGTNSTGQSAAGQNDLATAAADALTSPSGNSSSLYTGPPQPRLDSVGTPSLSAPETPSLAADSTNESGNTSRAGMEAADRSNLARGNLKRERTDSKIADGNSLRGISDLLTGSSDVGSAANRDFTSLGLDPIRRETRLPEIRVAEIETQRFRRRELGGPTLAAGSVPTPTRAFANRAKRLQSDSPSDSSNAFGPETEEAIELGLEFLTGTQNSDGSWHLRDFDTPVKIESQTAATGLALLSFQGAGYTHRQFQYSKQCNGAIQFLIENQKENGDLFIPAGEPADINAWLYSHAIASLALCEAYGMTQDATLRQPAQRAVNFMVASQDKINGGWRYRPAVGSDTSVSGWFMMALKSAQLAGLEVPPEVFVRLERWLVNSAASKSVPHEFRYNYLAPDTDQKRHGRVPTPVMTSVGLLMRLYLGWQRDDTRMQAGADHLLEHPPEIGNAAFRKRDTYYWYYGTQVMFHVGGEKWRRWNERLYPILIESQSREGKYRGSWDPMTPVPDQWGEYGGRLYVTTVNLLSLEVNYRHLPLYESTATEESPTPSKVLRPKP